MRPAPISTERGPVADSAREPDSVPDTPRQKYKTRRRLEIPGHARALNFACFHNQAFLSSSRACECACEGAITALSRHACDLWAWCFMPTHAHFLVLPRAREALPDISAFLSTMKKSVALRAIGHVRVHSPEFLVRMRDQQPNGKVSLRFWQRGGGYDRNIHDRHTLWNEIRYIHRNPVAAGLCKRADEWPWSSAAAFAKTGESRIPINFESLKRWCA